MKKILGREEFPKKLASKEKEAQSSFVAVVWEFLGNHKAENYVSRVENYGPVGCRVQILDKFKENMVAYPEEQDERFHQGILDFERCYQVQRGHDGTDFVDVKT